MWNLNSWAAVPIFFCAFAGVLCCGMETLQAATLKNPLSEYSGSEFILFYVIVSMIAVSCALLMRAIVGSYRITSSLLSAAPNAAVVGLGAWRFFIGLSRGKPVGILTILMALNSSPVVFFSDY